jgi:uncharacterized protein
MLARPDDIEADLGPRRAGTDRLCVVTREVKPIDAMIRFVLGPDGAVVPDLKRKLPGRGVWVTARQQSVRDAVSRGAFQRGFKSAALVSKDLPILVARLLERSVLDALAIANKAGEVIAGFAKVEAAVVSDPVVAIFHGSDAGADGVRKIAAALQRRIGEGDNGDHSGGLQEIVKITSFTSAQLDLALGRTNVVHAALLAGRTSNTVLERWQVFDRFRMGDPDGDAGSKALRHNSPKPGME